jgi:hypothetical protein
MLQTVEQRFGREGDAMRNRKRTEGARRVARDRRLSYVWSRSGSEEGIE